jgi:UDP-N-acetylmuramoyl-L-alanyl-D-glutamate--2,6-diaminopimelate ligase
MKLRDLISPLDHPVVSGSLDTEVTALAYDSRKAGPGVAFVALRGTTVDGHHFIQSAINAGAACIIAEQAPAADCNVPWVHVKQSRIALAKMAAVMFGIACDQSSHWRAVTGTNGKSTIAFLWCVISSTTAQRRCGSDRDDQSYDLGVVTKCPATHTTPESLEIQQLLAQMVDNGCRACAMEVSSHALHQHRVEGLQFSAAAFTQLTQDHLDYHGTMDAYFRGKGPSVSRTWQMLAAGQMVINGDDAWGRKLIMRKFENTGRDHALRLWCAQRLSRRERAV